MSDQLLHQIELNLKLLKFLDCEDLFFKIFLPSGRRMGGGCKYLRRTFQTGGLQARGSWTV